MYKSYSVVLNLLMVLERQYYENVISFTIRYLSKEK